MKKVPLLICFFLIPNLWLIANNGNVSEESRFEYINLFIGRFHPLFVHLPIGLIVGIFFIEIYAHIKKIIISPPLIGLLTLLTLVSSIISIVMGYLLSTSGDYDLDSINNHMYTAYFFLLLNTLLLIFHTISFKKNLKIYRYLYIITLFLCVLFISITGHYGGVLTHGSSYLSEHAPWNYKPKKIITDINKAIVFEDIVLPIFEKKCISCHNADKIKGGLRIDDYDLLLKGGESGKVIIKGNPEKSELYHLATLPSSEKRAMPPDGKTPLTKEELQIIYWWIKNGAENQKIVQDLSPSREVIDLLSNYYTPSSSGTSLIEQIKVPELSEEALNQYYNTSILVLRISKNESKLDVQFKTPQSVNKAVISKLEAINKNIVYLHLSNSSVKDEDLKEIQKFENLNQLYLQNTAITNKSLSYIKELKYLEILNLYNTSITNEGINHLKDCKNLKKVFLWGSKADSSILATVKTTNPQMVVYFGIDSNQVNQSKK
ncbi:MAG: hypothetical protein EAZ07_01750 [Cytophagales bacterium]|nr:MAG: hypothetical protein EAZ07_01750 [Cytophagales bacterium]